MAVRLSRIAAAILMIVLVIGCAESGPKAVGPPFEVVAQETIGLNGGAGSVDYYLVALPGVTDASVVVRRYAAWLEAKQSGVGLDDDAMGGAGALDGSAIRFEVAGEFVAGGAEPWLAEELTSSAGSDLSGLLVVSVE